MEEGTGAVGGPLDLSGRNSRLARPLFHPPVAFYRHFSQRASTLFQYLAQAGPHRGLCEIIFSFFLFFFFLHFSFLYRSFFSLFLFFFHVVVPPLDLPTPSTRLTRDKLSRPAQIAFPF